MFKAGAPNREGPQEGPQVQVLSKKRDLSVQVMSKKKGRTLKVPQNGCTRVLPSFEVRFSRGSKSKELRERELLYLLPVHSQSVTPSSSALSVRIPRRECRLTRQREWCRWRGVHLAAHRHHPLAAWRHVAPRGGSRTQVERGARSEAPQPRPPRRWAAAARARRRRRRDGLSPPPPSSSSPRSRRWPRPRWRPRCRST